MDEERALDSFSFVYCDKIETDEGRGGWMLSTPSVCGRCLRVNWCSRNQPVTPRKGTLYLAATRGGVVDIGTFEMTKDGLEFDMKQNGDVNAEENVH